MVLEKLSENYSVRKLNHNDIDKIYSLSIGNPLFYKYCPPPATRRGIEDDMEALPPGKTESDKFYAGFFDKSDLIAVMDLILAFPDDETAFIGFFMMNKDCQGRGIGTKIITDAAEYLKSAGFRRIRLAYAKGNPQSEAFWIKNGFAKAGLEIEDNLYTKVVMQREL